jgi:hypothetical protein
MPWARLDDGFHGHPKVRETSLAARGLFATALSYCANYLTDGHLPAPFVADHARGPLGKRALAELDERHWFEARDDGSYVVVGYLDYNDSREDIEEQRRQARERQGRFRARGKQTQLPWDGAGEAPRNAVTNAAHSTPPTPSKEDPPSPPLARGDESDDLLEQIKASLSDRLPDYVHATWIAPVELVAQENGTLTIAAPPDVRGWLRERYAPLMAAAASELEGRPMVVVVAESDEERSQRIRNEHKEKRRDERAERALRQTEPGGSAA